VDEFTDELAPAAGGWDRRFARVLAEAALGDRAVGIIDSNGAHGGAPVYENTGVDRWDPQSEWSGLSAAAATAPVGPTAWPTRRNASR